MAGRDILSDAYVDRILKNRETARAGDIHTGGFIPCPYSLVPGWPVHFLAVWFRRRFLVRCDECGWSQTLYGRFWDTKAWRRWLEEGGRAQAKPPRPILTMSPDEARLWLANLPHLKMQMFPGRYQNGSKT